MLCGLTTRLAPARRSLPSFSSRRTRATMNSSGRSARALRVTNRLPASVSSAAIRARALRTPARSRTSSSVASPSTAGYWMFSTRIGSLSTTTGLARIATRSRYGSSDASLTADDDVLTHARDLALHPAPPEHFWQLTLEECLDDDTEGVESDPDADDDQRDREDLAGSGQRLDLAKPHGRDRGDCLVESIEETESEHE